MTSAPSNTPDAGAEPPRPPYPRDIYCERQTQSAEAAYADHQVRRATHRSDEERWVLSRIHEDGSADSHLRQEIVIGTWGTVIIHGDGANLMFQSYRESGPMALLRWVASASSLYYLAEKVPRGTSTTEQNEEVALAEAKWQLQHEGLDEAVRELLLRFVEFPHSFPLADLNEQLGLAVEDAPWSLGDVPLSQLFLAQAAIRRLHAWMRGAG